MSSRASSNFAVLYAEQQQVVGEQRRFNVLACGRRFGKTTLGIHRLVDPEILGFPVAWFAPTHKMLREVWRELRHNLGPQTTRADAQEHRLELTGGGIIDMWSLDSANTARGRKYRRVVIDEAAMVHNLEESWQQVVRPTLTDYEGDAWFLSTPHGVNFFKDLFDRGRDPERPQYASWRMPTSVNPHIKMTEFEAARDEVPDHVFRQEYLAEFLENEGAVFRNLDACLTATDTRPEDHQGHRKVAGVDWGQKNDFTAISVLCVTCMTEVELDRFNRIDWGFQRGRLRAIYDRWNISLIRAEENSIGSPMIEALRSEQLNVRAFTTTLVTKPRLIQSLALAFERLQAKWLDSPVATAELVGYESRLNSVTGRISFGAPEGRHDDTVIARALALHAAIEGAVRIEEGPSLW